MNKQYDWDLDILLKKASLEELHKQWLHHQKQIIDSYDTFLNSFSNFANYLKLGEEYVVLSNRLFNYVHNNLNEDVVNQK
jgi:oligoendopeptidase F